jgi:hypothetical protein
MVGDVSFGDSEPFVVERCAEPKRHDPHTWIYGCHSHEHYCPGTPLIAVADQGALHAPWPPDAPKIDVGGPPRALPERWAMLDQPWIFDDPVGSRLRPIRRWRWLRRRHRAQAHARMLAYYANLWDKLHPEDTA